MDRGAIVLWPARWPFKRLYDEKISVGSRSFSLSYQNDAEDDENAVIRPGMLLQKVWKLIKFLLVGLENLTNCLLLVCPKIYQTG